LIIQGMVINMNEAKLTTLEQTRAFIQGTNAVEFSPYQADDDRYRHISNVLTHLNYQRLSKPDKGVVLRYLERTTGYSRQQLTRLVGRWRSTGRPLVKRYRAPSRGWERKFNDPDVALLAETDQLHATLSGPATRHLMARELELFGDTRYARLAKISVAHLYNLRKRAGYINRRCVITKTRPTGIAITSVAKSESVIRSSWFKRLSRSSPACQKCLSICGLA